MSSKYNPIINEEDDDSDIQPGNNQTNNQTMCNVN